jgi:hypothetical protein
MKTYLFNQPAGIGDIFFIMAVAQKYKKEGHKIVWPTKYHYHNIQKNFPEVWFVPIDYFIGYDYYDQKREIFEDEKYITIPFRWADVILHGKSILSSCMRDKYDLIGLPMDYWRQFEIKRDHAMEDKLFQSLGLEGKEYNIINENQTVLLQKTKINVDNGLTNIYMNMDDHQYNLLDWLKVMENAKTIHTVATSVLVLIEKMEEKAEERHIYKRIWDNDHSSYDYYLDKNYVFH